jgi:hypothetical protein
MGLWLRVAVEQKIDLHKTSFIDICLAVEAFPSASRRLQRFQWFMRLGNWFWAAVFRHPAPCQCIFLISARNSTKWEMKVKRATSTFIFYQLIEG